MNESVSKVQRRRLSSVLIEVRSHNATFPRTSMAESSRENSVSFVFWCTAARMALRHLTSLS